MYTMNFVNVLLVLHFPGIVISSQFVDNLPAEIQSAQCTITAGEIKASAEATVSKKLEGVCGSNEMQQAFEELERKLLLELQSIKLLLGANLKKNSMVDEKFVLDTPKEQVVGQTEEPVIDRTKFLESSSIAAPNIYHQKQNQKYILESTTVKDEIVLKSLNTRKTKKKSFSDSLVLKNKKGSSRDTEIKKLNNTLLSGEEIKLYSYYWKIENFTEKLKQNASHESSPLFNILSMSLNVQHHCSILNKFIFQIRIYELRQYSNI